MVRNMPSEEKCICSECVGEPFLRDSIRSRGKEARCSYCEKQGATIRISEMADAVDAALAGLDAGEDANIPGLHEADAWTGWEADRRQISKRFGNAKPAPHYAVPVLVV